jgi:hypothetical protein
MDKQRFSAGNPGAAAASDLTVTQARGGVRRGVSKVLVVSTLLAVVAITAVALLAVHNSPAPLAAAPQGSVRQSDILRSRAWAAAHLGPAVLAKCQAFRQVVDRTAQLQAAGGGTLSTAETARLEAELRAATSMSPSTLTPFQCGVPL